MKIQRILRVLATFICTIAHITNTLINTFFATVTLGQVTDIVKANREDEIYFI